RLGRRRTNEGAQALFTTLCDALGFENRRTRLARRTMQHCRACDEGGERLGGVTDDDGMQSLCLGGRDDAGALSALLGRADISGSEQTALSRHGDRSAERRIFGLEGKEPSLGLQLSDVSQVVVRSLPHVSKVER